MRQSVAEIYDAHADQLYRYALILLTDHAAAEDAMQQVFAKLARNSGTVSGIKNESQYLKTAIRNECFRILADKKRRRQYLQSDTGNALLQQVAPEQGSDEQREEIETALKKLPPEQRETVYLKVYEDMTFKEIAKLLKIEPNTAASRYRYGMDKLRQHLTDRF